MKNEIKMHLEINKMASGKPNTQNVVGSFL